MLYVAGVSEWKAFLAGWIIAVVNFELLHRIGKMLLSAMAGGKPGFWIYLLLVMKFVFWGGVILFLSSTEWLRGTYFVAGTMTILLSGLVFGLKELNNRESSKDTQYAR